MTQTKANPMQSAHAAPRCTATSKRSGTRCKAPAVKGWRVCRMHGARGGAPEGSDHGQFVHGAYSKANADIMALLRMLKGARR